MEKVKSKHDLKLIFILLCVAFAIPSIVHLITGKSISNLVSSFTFFYTNPSLEITPIKIISAILFLTIFLGISFVYYKIVKEHKKIFINNKQMAKFIVIVSIIFLIMLPLTSTDVFYYIGTGWSEACYGVNPYYTSVQELMQVNTTAANDEILLKMPGVWAGQTIVYGPVWPLICKILSGLSMGNLAFALFIYKLFNLILHISNAYLIYKITKGKKVFVLAYALNPLVLFDGITNVHNEMLVIFFILLALYFFVRKKDMFFTVVFFALATAVKYFAILLVPFIVLYYYRKEKPLKKILYSSLWAIVFIIVLCMCYALYMRDFSVLKGIATQQSKFSNSMFIFLAIRKIDLAITVSKGFMLAFVIIYIFTIFKLLFTTKKYTLSTYIRQYNFLLILFIFGTITNLQSWYMLWLLPTIMWQSSDNIKQIMAITIIAEISNIIYFIYYESYIFGQFYIILTVLLNVIVSYKNEHNLKQRAKEMKHLV